VPDFLQPIARISSNKSGRKAVFLQCFISANY
jgi:hypothetical protein